MQKITDNKPDTEILDLASANPYTPSNENYTLLQRVPWYKIHGGMDFLGEVSLLGAGFAALSDQGAIAIPVVVASVVAVVPDMAHSLIGLVKGDGSHASADISVKLSEEGKFIDPQDRYDDAVRAAATIVGHYTPFTSVKLSDEELEQAKDKVKVNRGIFINFKEYPNEAGRTMEGCGKIAQVFIGAAAMAYNPIGGAFQAVAGALNAAAVVFDFIPESTGDQDISEKRSVLQRAWDKVKAAPQTFAGGTQLAATGFYIPAAINFGLSTMQGRLLCAAVCAWVIGYGAKMMATKRGYGAREFNM